MAAAACHPRDGPGEGQPAGPRSSHLLVFILWRGQAKLEIPWRNAGWRETGVGSAPNQPSPAPARSPGQNPPPARGHLAGGGALVASPLALSWWSQGQPRERRASPPAPPSQHKGKVVLSPGLPSAQGQKLWDTLTARRASLTALIVKALWQQGCPHPY